MHGSAITSLLLSTLQTLIVPPAAAWPPGSRGAHSLELPRLEAAAPQLQLPCSQPRSTSRRHIYLSSPDISHEPYLHGLNPRYARLLERTSETSNLARPDVSRSSQARSSVATSNGSHKTLAATGQSSVAGGSWAEGDVVVM